jgi:para-aminobenzoate synthetase component 1
MDVNTFKMDLLHFVNMMNRWGEQQIPFLFIVDFEMVNPLIMRLEEARQNEILYFVNGITNAEKRRISRSKTIEKRPGKLSDYERKFNQVLRHLEYGDTFLTNLTISTEVVIANSLQDIFFQSDAKYKLLFKDQFLVFSPETFVKIKDGKIYSYPMKGTIDASVANAKEIILADRKELAEHVTIVDLIRNDLSQVASNVTVKRFRYLDEVRTDGKNLLQVSSEICGHLDGGYRNTLGNILLKLLPAGSVSGAPKPKTLQIIREVEGESRGFYTGIFGYFDGVDLDSGVMIRFIERRGDRFFYRSGGGITTQSVVELEYQEAIDKVYVPVA